MISSRPREVNGAVWSACAFTGSEIHSGTAENDGRNSRGGEDFGCGMGTMSVALHVSELNHMSQMVKWTFCSFLA